MDIITSRIFEAARLKGEKLNFISLVKDNINKRECFISISDLNLNIYINNDLISMKSYPWLRLNKINITNRIFIFDFGDINDRYEFSIEKSYEIEKQLEKILPSIFKESELSKIGYECIYKNVKYSHISAFNRAKYKIHERNIANSDIHIKSIEHMLCYVDDTVDLMQFTHSSDILEIFVDILPLIPNVIKVTLPSIKSFDGYLHASSLLQEMNSLKCISINGTVTQSFQTLLSNVSSMRSSKLSGLYFYNSQFTDKHLDLLVSYIGRCDLSTLGLHNSVSQKYLGYFYTTIINNDVLKKLMYINFDKISLDYKLITQQLLGVKFLSLTYCSLDIGKFLETLSKRGNAIMCLNLSGNYCREDFSSFIYLPDSITAVKVDNVEWGDYQLSTFMSILFRSSLRNIKLSIANATASESEWNRVYNSLKICNSSTFGSLVWDRNPIRKTFFEFLNTQKDLTYLGVGGCLHSNNKDLVNSLGTYIKSSDNIKSLSVWSDDASYLGLLTIDILECLESRNPLSYLDIRNSKSGDTGLIQLKNLLNTKNSPLFTNFDGMGIERGPILVDFMRSLPSIGNNITISFPIKDIEYLYRLKRITSEEYYDIKYKYSTDGFHVFTENLTIDFPVFITDQDVEILRKARIHKSSYKKANTLEGISPPSKRLFELSSHCIDTKERNSPRTIDPGDICVNFSNRPKRRLSHQNMENMKYKTQNGSMLRSRSTDLQAKLTLPSYESSSSESSSPCNSISLLPIGPTSDRSGSIPITDIEGYIKKKKDYRHELLGSSPINNDIKRLEPFFPVKSSILKRRQLPQAPQIFESDPVFDSFGNPDSLEDIKKYSSLDSKKNHVSSLFIDLDSDNNDMRIIDIDIPPKLKGKKAKNNKKGKGNNEIKKHNQKKDPESKKSSSNSQPSENDTENKKTTKEVERKKAKKKKLKKNMKSFNWEFPIKDFQFDIVAWTKTEEMYAIDEIMNVLSQTPHEIYKEEK